MTQCLRPLAPTDEELLRHALDEESLSIAAKEHLEQCTLCQQRLANYTTTNDLLLSRFYRSQCPNATLLSHYCIGMLSIDEATKVASHLEICPLCSNEVAETRLVLATFEPFPDEHSSTPSSIQYIVASPIPWQPQSLIWDPSGHEQEQRWPRQYQADAVSISLHLTRNKQGAIFLLGLLSSATEHLELLAGAKVELYSAHNSFPFSAGEDASELSGSEPRGPLLSTQIDELGHIVFPSVPPGFYLMIIYLPETEVVIEELNIHSS